MWTFDGSMLSAFGLRRRDGNRRIERGYRFPGVLSKMKDVSLLLSLSLSLWESGRGRGTYESDMIDVEIGIRFDERSRHIQYIYAHRWWQYLKFLSRSSLSSKPGGNKWGSTCRGEQYSDLSETLDSSFQTLLLVRFRG